MKNTKWKVNDLIIINYYYFEKSSLHKKYALLRFSKAATEIKIVIIIFFVFTQNTLKKSTVV